MEMIAEGQKVKAVHDIEGEFVSAGSTGTVTGVVDASKYGMSTLYSVLFFENGEDREPLVQREEIEPV